ncbi:hypothetical protein EN745_28245 [Mesorhizobium sp. M4A.F.Ca.ET.022.05.2.1]|uniref:hypothetical protein n=1 Tax=Mesorhizobium sp. M4A.F.Ca.ET.022.05.2.1 TaxID=2496653 RepID=UPI000FCCC323|nr:hypothetical protein [Mesorhizobium sp. M4A.F.Ca.ET.022.05.2.1]RVC75150.1 hypothetical protein EN745_28245 [Mesorhizobium sp. M4A.F.Ca.ET.022.05.2.1]
MIAVIIRIALRYGAAVLVARGLLGAGDAAALSGDPDIQMALEAGIGLAIGLGTEAWHVLARKFNWQR